MSSADLLVLKDEKAKKKQRRDGGKPIRTPRQNREDLVSDRISRYAYLGNHGPRKEARTAFTISGLDSLRLKPKSFVTLGMALGATSYFLDNDSEQEAINKHIADGLWEACKTDPEFTFTRPTHDVIAIGVCQDFILDKIKYNDMKLVIENVTSGWDSEEIHIGITKEFVVNYEFCIVPVKSLEYFRQHKPDLAKLFYAMLKKFEHTCDVLRIHCDELDYAFDMFEERMYDYEYREDELEQEEKEELESMRASKAIYEPDGIISLIEKEIDEVKEDFRELAEKFTPSDKIEQLYYDWIIQALDIIEIREPIQKYDCYLIGEDEFMPVIPSMGIRFVWSEVDAVYREFYDRMQMNHQEGGVISPTMYLRVEEALKYKPGNEALFLKRMTAFMQRGHDVYYEYCEMMKIDWENE